MADSAFHGLCPECGEARSWDDDFCGVCGAALPVSDAAVPGLPPNESPPFRRMVILAALVAGVALELALVVWMLIAG
jgi:predicted amidophosphoribosyltransferase